MRMRRRAGGTRRGDSFAPCSEDTRRGLSSRPHSHRRIRRLSRKFPCRCPLFLPSGNGWLFLGRSRQGQDRKSTRLNSSHSQISYAVFCLKKKKTETRTTERRRNPVYAPAPPPCQG